MDGTVESDPESKEEHIAQQTGQEEADEVERGSEAGGRDGDPMEEQRADDDGEGGSGRGRSASEVPPSEFSDGVPHGGEHEQHRPAAATRRPRDRVQSWYRWKKRCKNAIKAGLEKHEGLALFCTLSPHGRWQTRGSQSLIGDPAFPVIEQQLQRLAAAKHELGAARAGIFQNATQRRRGERVAAAEVAAQPESGCNAENQRRPSKVVRAKARRIGKSVGFQRKLQSVLDGAKACNKDVCRAEHQTALTDAPCYPFRQAMGWPDSVPFSTALGELTTREQSDFVAAFAPYEDLQPMDEGEQAGRGEPGQQTTRNAQMPAGSGAVTIKAIYAFLRSCQAKVPSRRPMVRSVPVRLDSLAMKVIDAGGHLQFRRSKGYLTFMYSEDGLNIDRPQQGGEIKEGDSDALDRKEGEAVKKLKGLYKRYLKSYVEWRLGESEEEADTDSDDEDSDRVMDRGGSKDGKGPTEGGVDSEEGSDYTSQSDGVARTHPQERSETSLSDGVDSEELDFLERDKEEDLAEWQEDYWRWAQGGAMPECDTPLHEGAALQQGENGSQQAAFGSTQSEWASQPSPLPRDGETLSPKTSPVATASAAEQAGQSAQHPLEQELPSQQIPVTRTAPGTQPAQSSSKHAEAAEQQEARPALESERTVTSDSGDPPEAAKLSCIVFKKTGSRSRTEHVCQTCQGPVHNACFRVLVGDTAGGYSCDKHHVRDKVPPTFESDPGDVPAAAVTTPGTAEPSWRPNEAVFGWSSAPSTGQNTSSSGHLSNKSARATTSPNAAPTGPARSSNEPHTHQKSAPSAGQKTAASPSHSDESAPAKAPASGVPGTSSQPPNCTGRSAPRADGEATPNPFPSGESAPTTAPATAPTSVRSPGVPSWPTDKPPYAVGDSRLVGERLPPSPRPSHKNASATAAMSGALGGSPRPPKQPPRVEGNAPLMKEMTPPSPLPNSHNVPANAPATAPACGTSGGRPPNQPPGAGRNAPQVGGRMAPPGLRPSSESTFATAPASRASGGPSRSSNQPPPTQKNASPLGEEAPASSLPGRGRGPSIPPASKKRGREEDEAAFVTGGSGGGVVHRKKRSATRPQNHSVSRLAPSQDVTEIFDAPGTHIYAGDVIEGDGSVVRGPEWHARFSQRGKRWRQRPKKGRTEARPRKEEPRFRQTGRGIQILVPYQRGTRPQWILLETASFDEMNRLAAVANIEPDKDVHGGTVEEIELRYRNAIREAANDFFLSSNK